MPLSTRARRACSHGRGAPEASRVALPSAAAARPGPPRPARSLAPSRAPAWPPPLTANVMASNLIGSGAPSWAGERRADLRGRPGRPGYETFSAFEQVKEGVNHCDTLGPALLLRPRVSRYRAVPRTDARPVPGRRQADAPFWLLPGQAATRGESRCPSVPKRAEKGVRQQLQNLGQNVQRVGVGSSPSPPRPAAAPGGRGSECGGDRHS